MTSIKMVTTKSTNDEYLKMLTTKSTNDNYKDADYQVNK